MCGRYSLFDEQDNEEMRRIISSVNRKYPSQPVRLGEIFPTNAAPVLVGDLSPKPIIWGFPKYSGSGVIINARAETAEEKKTFRQGLFTGRCVVPSTGFFEWDAQKRKYLFRLPGEKMLYMAGICREYEGVMRYVILTTAANDSMKDVHSRMPVILPRDKLRMWAFDTGAAIDYLRVEMPALVRIG